MEKQLRFFFAMFSTSGDSSFSSPEESTEEVGCGVLEVGLEVRSKFVTYHVVCQLGSGGSCIWWWVEGVIAHPHILVRATNE